MVMKEVLVNFYTTSFPNSQGHQKFFHHLFSLPHGPKELSSTLLFINHMMLATDWIPACSSVLPSVPSNPTHHLLPACSI
jgi:hypothetical protein